MGKLYTKFSDSILRLIIFSYLFGCTNSTDSQMAVNHSTRATKSACCWCQEKGVDEEANVFSNVLTPARSSSDDCSHKMESGSLTNCRSVTVIDGPCSLISLKRMGSSYQCTAVERHYLENGNNLSISPPEKLKGICDPETRMAAASLISNKNFATKGSTNETNTGPNPCANDVKTHCSEVEPGGGRIVDCLDDHLDKLSSDCAEERTSSRR